MKVFFVSLLLFSAVTGYTQQDTVVHVRHSTYERHTTMITASLGLADFYRQYYSLPGGYQKSNTSGFAPIYLKLEYGVAANVSIALTMCYDAFRYNFRQEYTGNNGPFTRYRNDNTRIISGGVTGFYHLGNVIRVKHLDPFVGVGASLNNIRHGAYPQGDSSVVMFDHTVTPYLKAGVRYYLASGFSLFADVGYDQQSIVSVGASCRFFGRGRKK